MPLINTTTIITTTTTTTTTTAAAAAAAAATTNTVWLLLLGVKSRRREADVDEHVSTPVLSARGIATSHPPVLPRLWRGPKAQLLGPQSRTDISHQCLVSLYTDHRLAYQDFHTDSNLAGLVAR